MTIQKIKFGLFTIFILGVSVAFLQFRQSINEPQSELQQNVVVAQEQAMELICETPADVYQEYVENKKERHSASEYQKKILEARNITIRGQYPSINNCFDGRR